MGYFLGMLAHAGTYELASSPFPPPLFSPSDMRRDITLPYWGQQGLDTCSQVLGLEGLLSRPLLTPTCEVRLRWRHSSCTGQTWGRSMHLPTMKLGG